MSQPRKAAAKKKPAAKKTKPSTRSTSTFKPGADPLAVVTPAIHQLVTAVAGFQPQPASFDVALAEAHESAYQARLDAIPADRVRILRLDADAVCASALAVHALIQCPALLERYQAAAESGDFNLQNLADLGALPFIVLDARRRGVAAGAFATNAKVPADIDALSLEVEARMQKVCEHFFWDHPEIGPVVQALQPGTSYQDRAYDLLGYADIYVQGREVVSTDVVHYRKTDVAEARRLAGVILTAIGASMSPQARTWYDLTQRAWTLLELVYNDVRAVGLAFLRADPLREQRFPSLYVVGRAAPTRRKARKQQGEQKPADGKPAEGKAAEDKATDGKAAEPKTETKADAGASAAAEKKPSPTK